MMKIGFIGLGKLGLPCALAIESKGHEVIGYDVSQDVKDIIANKKIPYREIWAQKHLEKSNVKCVEIEEVVSFSDIIFVAVQTPHSPLYEGITRLPDERVDFDYTYLKKAIQDVSLEITRQKQDKVVIIISTVLPGTVDRELRPLLTSHVKLCYNPFFIAMGTTMRDFLEPEFVLFGVDDKDAADKAEEFYKTIHDAPFYRTTIPNAELSKVLYNTYISSKIAVANTILELCHKIPGADADGVVNALFLGTERLISTKYLIPGMGDGGGCFLPDQHIYLDKGVCAIEDVIEGDKVLSTEGSMELVQETYKRPYKGDVIKLKVRGLPEEYLTPNHPVYVSKDLRKKYILKDGTEKKYTNKPAHELVGETEEIPAGLLTDDYYVLFPKPRDLKYAVPSHVNSDYIELAGYYLSEGSISERKDRPSKFQRVSFYFHEDEQDYLNEVESLIKKRYGNDAYTSRHKKIGSKCESIRYNNIELCENLVNDFGKGSEFKTIPEWILYGSEKHSKLLLKGLFRGDGCSSTYGFSYSTISKDLAYGVNILLKKLGIACTLQKHPERIGNDGVKHKEAYEVSIRNATYIEKLADIVQMEINHKMQDKKYKNIIFEKDGYYYHKIQSIENISYSGTVYNLNINNTHAYVSETGLHANCHPRDNIALSWLSRELDLSYDWFENIMVAREKQTEWLGDLIMEQMEKNPDLPAIILGKCFKKETNLTIGSPSILLRNILEEKGVYVDMYDPYVDENPPPLDEPAIFFIGTNHDLFLEYNFPKGSVVLDPWRMIEDQNNVEVIRIGE